MTQVWNASPQESRGYLSNEFLQIYLYSDICGDDARWSSTREETSRLSRRLSKMTLRIDGDGRQRFASHEENSVPIIL